MILIEEEINGKHVLRDKEKGLFIKFGSRLEIRLICIEILG